MEEFKIISHGSMQASPLPFQVHVIGYKNLFDGYVNVPSGMPCTFIAFFHDSVEAGTADGVREIPANSLFVFEPSRQLFSGRSEGSWLRSWIRCSGLALSGILKENRIPYNKALVFDNAEVFEEYLFAMYRELRHPLGSEQQNLTDIFRLWMRNVKRCCYGSSSPGTPEKFLKAKQFIEGNYFKTLTLEKISGNCGMSREHLCKGFKKYFNSSPIDYCIRLRLEYAVELLEDINLNISEIAEICGYRNIFYFSKAFKKLFGVSPSGFRMRGLKVDC